MLLGGVGRIGKLESHHAFKKVGVVFAVDN